MTKPTVSLGATYAVAYTYGRDDGRIVPTHCAVIDDRLGGRWRAIPVKFESVSEKITLWLPTASPSIERSSVAER